MSQEDKSTRRQGRYDVTRRISRMSDRFITGKKKAATFNGH